jgi:hypothetical protein
VPARVFFILLATLMQTPAWALDAMDPGYIAKMAKETGRPVKALLTGPAGQYLRSTFQTSAPIYAEAIALRKIDGQTEAPKIRGFRLETSESFGTYQALIAADPSAVGTALAAPLPWSMCIWLPKSKVCATAMLT